MSLGRTGQVSVLRYSQKLWLPTQHQARACSRTMEVYQPSPLAQELWIGPNFHGRERQAVLFKGAAAGRLVLQ